MFATGFSRLALALGFAGLLPFVGAAMATWLAPVAWQGVAINAFLAYSAVILSFLGGVQWGVAMSWPSSGHDVMARLVVSMAPSLIAWPALMLHPLSGAWALAAGFVVMRLYELSREGRQPLPAWYQRLRTLLTLVVLICHAAVIWRFMVV
ncbi:DUF3429 domain-containing protein [Halomonas urumqiensis]|uniref:DUF3429 domain-containing protein n=1 Tax=Halomonas urumqiensis TaxID=1684789 RepID=A0A2N7UC64_9GAMM|nr:DUF3429 domain-containing protein [Halomonas urumqiensis]PMR78000.1 DUF3429 domain-containing protein [Halomonas urumqiensis]PTB03151.1 DUF3429 domain-containing protein [Halomonas urumqiensis]GHE20707.1 hypothetical protein GCM10017767_12280 [Halomonas urumqiensis]